MTTRTLAHVRHVPSDALYASSLGLLFVALATAVVRGRTQTADVIVRRTQSHPRGGPRRSIARCVKVVAQPNAQLALAALMTGLLRRARIPQANAIFAATTTMFLLEKGCKEVLRRQRPPGYRGKEGDQSFPSGHTAATTALTLSLARTIERDGLVRAPRASLGALVLIALVGESRLALDEHWPTDVLAGVLLGGASAYGALFLTQAPRLPAAAGRRTRFAHWSATLELG